MKFAQLNRQFVWSYVLVSWIPQLQISAVNFKLLLFHKKKEDRYQIYPQHPWPTTKLNNFPLLTLSIRLKAISSSRTSPWFIKDLILSRDAKNRPLILTIIRNLIWKRLITNTIKLTSRTQVPSTTRTSTMSTMTPSWLRWSCQTLFSPRSMKMTAENNKWRPNRPRLRQSHSRDKIQISVPKATSSPVRLIREIQSSTRS